MARREVTALVNIQSLEDFKETRRLYPELYSPTPFDDLIGELGAWAEAHIRAAGFPFPVRKTVRLLPDGSSCDDLQPGEWMSWTTTFALVTAKYERQTMTSAMTEETMATEALWYAVQICNVLETLRDARAAGDWQGALSNAEALGCLRTELFLKQGWDKPARVGAKIYEKGAAGGRISGEKRKACRTKRDACLCTAAKNLKVKHPRLSKKAIAAHLQKSCFTASSLSVDRLRHIIARCL